MVLLGQTTLKLTFKGVTPLGVTNVKKFKKVLYKYNKPCYNNNVR